MNLKPLLKKIYYSGLSHKCVYCNTNLRRLLPHGASLPILYELNVIGGKLRDNNKCPICGSNDRERLLYFYYEEVMLNNNQTSVSIKLLHIAPEKNFSRVLKDNPQIEYFSGDKFEKGYEGSYEAAYIDICDSKLPDNYLDYIICNHVLEHVDSYQKALHEIKRILKPGGRAVLQVPIAGLLKTTIEDTTLKSKEEREAKFGQYDHVRLFGQDYPEILANNGFTVNQYSSRELCNGKVKKYALNPDEIIFEIIK